MKVTIDQKSGYCFGVEFAIEMAEDYLEAGETLYCLGDIVHNAMEVKRLEEKGLKIVTVEELADMRDCKVLIRAHGEPPETYKTAIANNIQLIDASCPVVLKLQNRVKLAYDRVAADEGQMVIYGKKGHAEVIGLTGQTAFNAIVVTTEEDLDQLDYTKPISLFSQTTKSTKGFYAIKEAIEKRVEAANGTEESVKELFDGHDSICRQVSNREPNMEIFSQEHDVIIFVAGKKSSNGRALYSVCKSFNSNSFYVENEEEIDMSALEGKTSVGIAGATSTPMWLMEKVGKYIEENA